MSARTNHLDSPEALEAFRAAMKQTVPPSLAQSPQPTDDPEETPSNETSFKTAEERSLSLEGQTTTMSDTKFSMKTSTSSVIKCLHCGNEMEMDQLVITSLGKGGSSKDSHNSEKDKTFGHFTPSNPEALSLSPKIGTSKVNVGTTTEPSTPASIAKTVESVGTSVPLDVVEMKPPPHLESPVHHRAVTGLLSEKSITPVSGELRVPQNSPANASTALPGTVAMLSNEIEDPFTREEAHDVVINVFKELAALSERTMSKKSPSPVKSSRDLQGGPSKSRQPSNANEASIHSSPLKFCRNDENLPPHMRATSRHAEPKFTSEEDLSPFHPEELKSNPGRLPVAQATGNYFSVLDPAHQSVSVGKSKESGGKSDFSPHSEAERKFKPPGLRSISTSSSGSSSTPTVSRGVEEAAEKPGPAPLFTFSIASAKQPGGVDSEPQLASPTNHATHLGTKDTEKKKPSKVLSERKLQTDLPSWFLEKYASKKPSNSSKTLSTAENAPEDLENQTIFKAWPGQAERSRPAAGIRTCHIKQLPTSSTPASVCSLVFGGALEYVKVHTDSESSTASATVRFLSIEDCKRFYEETANGLPFEHGIQSLQTIAWVSLGKDVDVIGGVLGQQIDQGVSRCVKAVPVDNKIDKATLTQLAAEKGRQLEAFEDGESKTGSRSVVWRFCDVAHAVAFRGVLARNQDFERCNVTFSDDPCALRRGLGEL